jgi:hypothetical protein
MTAIATPIFSSLVQELVLIMCKMHKIDSGTASRGSRINITDNDPNATSPYMTELIAKTRWVFREFISKLLLEVRT